MTTGQKVAVGGLRAGGLGAEGGVAAGGGDTVARGWEDPQSGLGEHPCSSSRVVLSGVSR